MPHHSVVRPCTTPQPLSPVSWQPGEPLGPVALRCRQMRHCPEQDIQLHLLSTHSEYDREKSNRETNSQVLSDRQEEVLPDLFIDNLTIRRGQIDLVMIIVQIHALRIVGRVVGGNADLKWISGRQERSCRKDVPALQIAD